MSREPYAQNRLTGTPWVASLALSLLLASCTSTPPVSVDRETETSGTFRSEATSFTILAWDFPMASDQIARDNAFDVGLANLEVTSWETSPDWGWWNWVLDILSVRTTTVIGTWGYDATDFGGETDGPR